MYQDSYKPQKLVKHYRGELITQEHSGFVYSSDIKLGETFGYPFYMRSCAKPLQASLIIDYDLDFTIEEIAICCASHAGEKCHVKLAKNLLSKIGLDEKYLKCGIHKPLSINASTNLIKTDSVETVFHNNCVGKHIMMLAVCKKNGWDIENYDKIDHPLQQIIQEKIYDLCEVLEEYPITKDGCGVPILSMPLENMLKGFLNLFCSPKYEKIKQAFLDYPYIIGGENRLDTKIMQNSNLIAKVGAGGLCIVVNPEQADGLIVKILDADMQAREITTLSLLKLLNWADIPYDNSIKTLHNEKVGVIEFVAIK